MSMTPTPEHQHVHEETTTPVVRDPEPGSGLVGYAAALSLRVTEGT